MNQEEWEEKSALEQYKYVSISKWEVTKRAGVDGTKKVGDSTAVSNYYHVSAGELQISHDHKDQQDAIREALDSCDNYKIAAEKTED
jgi:hypothetical protein